MTVLQVVANQAGAGKTCLIAGLLRHITASGRTAGYCKPFSGNPGSDPDVAFLTTLLSEAAPENTVPPAVPAPLPYPAAALSDQETDTVRDGVQAAASAVDHVFLESPDLITGPGSLSSLPYQLSDAIASKIVLLVRWQPGLGVAAVEEWTEGWRDRLAGIVFNHCPIYRAHDLEQTVASPLRDAGFPVWGTITEDRAMLSVTVRQIAGHLQGRWVQEPENQEPENIDAPVDHFLIGGNIMDSGPNYFGRYSAQAVITRAERPDIQLASLECDTRCLVLTGGGEPTEYIRVEAGKRGVPLISVPTDTMTTAEALNGILDASVPHTPAKADRFAHLMEQHLDMSALIAALG